MQLLKKMSWVFTVNVIILQSVAAQLPEVKAQLNNEKHIALNIPLPPKGFVHAPKNSVTEAIPFVLEGQNLDKFTQKIDLRLFASPQTTSIDVIKAGLREYYLTQCPSLPYETVDPKTQKSIVRYEKGKSTLVEEKLSNLDGYDVLEYGFTCKFHDFEQYLYARAYIGPHGAFEILYLKEFAKQQQNGDSNDMKQFIDSFALIDNK